MGNTECVISPRVTISRGTLKMKSKEAWATEIIKYLQDNPVHGLEEATEQIETIVGWVQIDTLNSIPAESIHMDS